MITKQWNVVQMDEYPTADGYKDVVFQVHWTLTATEGEYTGSVYGSIGVKHDPKVPYTPYAALTKDQVIGWVKEAMGAETVAAYEANVAQQIADQKNPKVVSLALPWAETSA